MAGTWPVGSHQNFFGLACLYSNTGKAFYPLKSDGRGQPGCLGTPGDFSAEGAKLAFQSNVRDLFSLSASKSPLHVLGSLNAAKGKHISKLEDPVHSRSDASSGGAHTACKTTLTCAGRVPASH